MSVSRRLAVSLVVDQVASEPKATFGLLRTSASRSLVGGLAAAAAWLAVAALTTFWPDKSESDWGYTNDFAALCTALAIALAVAAIAGVRFAGVQRVRRLAP